MDQAMPDAKHATEPRLLAITDIWRTVLEKDSIGPDTDFFDAGGNSMLLLAMLEQVQEQLNCEIPLEELADGVTPARIASLATQF